MRVSPPRPPRAGRATGESGREVEGEATAEGATDRFAKADESDGAVEVLSSPDSDSVTIVVVSSAPGVGRPV